MEYLGRGDMLRYLEARSRPLPEQETKAIAFQLVEALCLLHGEGFSHRDLKPSNILIVTSPPKPWWVKIGDFGLSKRIQAQSEQGSSHEHVKGTPAYMPPELLGLFPTPPGSNPDPMRADMWSLGESIYQILTKCRTFKDITALGEYVRDLSSFPLVPLRRARVSKEGIDFIQSCMTPQPRDRGRAPTALQHDWIKAPYQVQSAWPLDASR